MRRATALALGGAVLAWTASVHAEPTVRQSVSVDRPVAPGEAFDLTVEVEHALDESVSAPGPLAPDRWHLLDEERETTSDESGATTTFRQRVAIFRPGTTTLQARSIVVEGSETVTIETEPLTVKVVSALEDDLAWREAQPPVEIWVDDYTLLWVGGGAAMLGLVGLLAFFERRRRSMLPEPPPPPREPWEVALEKLGALAADDLVERGEYMIFWVRLSEAIREFLGRMHGFPPTELTTSEILANLRDVKWPPGLDIEDVARFLREGDTVKFGGVKPTVERSGEALRRAFSIVELSKPRPAEVDVATPRDEAGRGDAPASEARKDAEPRRITMREESASRWAPPEERKTIVDGVAEPLGRQTLVDSPKEADTTPDKAPEDPASTAPTEETPVREDRRDTIRDKKTLVDLPPPAREEEE